MNLISLEKQIRKIHLNQNYWFVRTNGGEYYKDFVNGGFVAIGHDKILLTDVSLANGSPNPSEFLAKKVRKYYEEYKMPTHTAKQILRFCYEIKKGDIVFVPSSSSSTIKFGEVLETPTYLKSDSNDNDDCPYEKRKPVKWFKSIDKNKLDPNLYKLIYSHHAVTNANDYAEYIDKSLYSLFKKGGKTHLVLDVATTRGIRGKDLFGLGFNLFDYVDDFSEAEKLNISSDDVEIKLNLNSPGTVELISYSVTVLIIIGFLIVFLNGGNFKVSVAKISFDLNVDSFLSKMTEFLNHKQNRILKTDLSARIKKMRIKDPDDVVKLLNAINGLNNDKNDEPEEEQV